MQAEARTIGSIAEEWDELADEVRASPFSRPGWIWAWWRAFGRGSLRALTVRRDGGLTGVLPIAREGSVIRSPTNPETPLYGFVAAEEASARGLASTVLALRPRRLELSHLGSDDSGFDALTSALRSQGFRTITRPIQLSAFLGTTGEWDAYQNTLDAKLRGEIRRRRRRLEELGELTFEVVEGPEQLAPLLAEGFRVERSGWKGTYGTAIDSDHRTRRFYGDVARWADERGWLRLAFLRLDARPIAFDLCLETDGAHYLLKTGYDRDFGRFGPGVILRSLMLERAFVGPIETYEFLGTVVGANNRWKLDWTTLHHERLRLDAFAPSVLGRAEWLAVEVGGPLSRRARAGLATALGPTGRHLLKRSRMLIRGLFSP